MNLRWTFVWRAVAAALSVVLLTACEKILTVKGAIGRPMLAEVIAQNPGRIVISSGGGVGEVGLDLADVIRAHDVSVRAAGICGSACVEYVFVASRYRSVSNATLLLFHNTSTAMKAIVERDPEAAVRTLFDGRSTRELNLYRAAGVDARLLLLPVLRMETECYDVLRRPDGSVLDVRFRARKAGWATSKETLQRLGLEFDGEIPNSRGEFAIAMSKVPHAPDAQFVFDDRFPDVDFETMRRRLTETPRCTDG